MSGSTQILHEQPGAQLVETSFREHLPLIDEAVAQAKPLLISRPKIEVYNREVEQPRDVGFFSDESRGYFYSRRVMHAQPLTPALKEILALINAKFDAEFNGLLVNRYNNGKDSVGAHADSEAALDPKSGVVAITWGAERKFRIRGKTPGKAGPILKDVKTRHGYALQMKGERFQKDLTHEVVAEAKIQGERVSITARRHVPADEEKLFAAYEKRAQKRARESEPDAAPESKRVA